jgi:hypothetical protein
VSEMEVDGEKKEEEECWCVGDDGKHQFLRMDRMVFAMLLQKRGVCYYGKLSFFFFEYFKVRVIGYYFVVGVVKREEGTSPSLSVFFFWGEGGRGQGLDGTKKQEHKDCCALSGGSRITSRQRLCWAVVRSGFEVVVVDIVQRMDMSR